MIPSFTVGCWPLRWFLRPGLRRLDGEASEVNYAALLLLHDQSGYVLGSVLRDDKFAEDVVEVTNPRPAKS